jgi:hypothetical protein
MRAIAALLALPVAMGDIGKTTYFGSHPETYYSFMHTYFNVADNVVSDTRPACAASPSCVCWAKLCILESSTQSCSGPTGNFQMHVVDAVKRPSGPLDISAYEAAFANHTAAFANASAAAAGSWDPFWDYNFAYSTSDLDHFVKAFAAGGVPALPFSWTAAGGGATMYSVLVHVPSTVAIIELQGTSLLAAEPAFHLDTPRFVPTDVQPRWEAPAEAAPAAAAASVGAVGAGGAGGAGASAPYLKPLRISYASSDLARDAAFYTTVLGATEVASYDEPAEQQQQQQQQRGGSATVGASTKTTKVFTVKSGDAVQVHLVERAAAAPVVAAAALTVAGFESDLNAAHAASLGQSGGHTVGFDKPCDFHYGHAGFGSLDSVVRAMDAMGDAAPAYRWFSGGKSGGTYAGALQQQQQQQLDDDEAGGGTYFIYIAQPNGACVQLIGTSTLAPSNMTAYDFCSGK